MAKTRCEICDRNFKNEESLAMHNSSKHSKQVIAKKTSSKKIKGFAVLIVVLIFIIGGIYFFSNIKRLPPTDLAGHIEVSPPSHVLKEPMELRIQKHMLEHIDGIEGARGGVVINYDCKNYFCEDDLILKLELFAEKYNYVYVAPFKNMKTQIALTKLNRIETLEEYDEEKINLFISS